MDQPKENPTSDPRSELMALNNDILQAEETGLKDNLAPLLADGFWIVRSTGTKQEREEFLEAAWDNRNLGRTPDQCEIYLYGACAVFTCRVTTSRSPDGGPGGRFWNTRLFIQQSGGWRCAAWQVMRICDA